MKTQMFKVVALTLELDKPELKSNAVVSATGEIIALCPNAELANAIINALLIADDVLNAMEHEASLTALPETKSKKIGFIQ